MTTKCNYCIVTRMAACIKDGYKLTMQPNPILGFPRGISIYIHLETEPATKDHFVAWFAHLPDKCYCDNIQQAHKN